MAGIGFSLGHGLAPGMQPRLPPSGLVCLFDPSDRSTLWQDVAGTVPVVSDATPVALMQDKSGNGHHLRQSVAAARPLYRTSGDLHWLEFDGVNDVMQGDSFPGSEETTIGIAFAHSGFTSGFATLFRAGTDLPRFYLAQSAPSHIRGFWGDGFLYVQRSAALSTLGVMSLVSTRSGNTAQLHSGGQSSTVSGLSAAAPAGGMFLGNPDFSGHFYRLAWYRQLLTPEERTLLAAFPGPYA